MQPALAGLSGEGKGAEDHDRHCGPDDEQQTLLHDGHSSGHGRHCLALDPFRGVPGPDRRANSLADSD